jgi:hypothetical protein
MADLSQIKPCSQKNAKAKDPEYICNPETGNWIKIGGGVHKQLVAKGALPSPVATPAIKQTQKKEQTAQKKEPISQKKQSGEKIPIKTKIPIQVKPEKWFLDRPIEDYSWKEDGVYISPSGEKFVLPNSKEFPKFIAQRFGKYKITTDLSSGCEKKTVGSGKPPLFSHQKFVTDYMSPDKPYRGLLLDHNLGSGKTRESIETSEQYRVLGVKVLIILPATLKPTWINEIRLWGNEDIRRPNNWDSLPADQQAKIDALSDKKIAEGYDFVSYNAATTVNLLKKAVGPAGLKHRFVIVEEVHNLISMMVNPTGKKGLTIYQMLMEAIDCKFLFLSATPLLNISYELGVLFNILKGPMMYNGQRYTLFPETQDEFDQYFVDYESQKIRNPELFKKRILGLVSYYYGAKGDVYPDLILKPATEIEFGDYQFKRYAEARMSEIEKEKGKPDDKKAGANLTGAKKKSVKDEIKSTFRIFSRQFSNYVFPPNVKRPMPNDYLSLTKLQLNGSPDKWSPEQITDLMALFDDNEDAFESFKQEYAEIPTDAERLKYLHELIANNGKSNSEFSNITSDDEQFIFEHLEIPSSYQHAIDNAIALLDKGLPDYFGTNLNIYGPKMEMIYRNITDEGNKGPSFVYSQFRTLEGVNMVAKVLKAHGFEELPHYSIDANNIATYATAGKKRYVVYSGEEDNTVRGKILWIYNHPLNKNGDICKVFMGTAAAAEGISLKNTRQVHILEPYWNEVRIQQVIGRARRICSHEALDKADRIVTVYRYHMTLTPKQKEKFPEAESTDEAIYRIAKLKEKINAQFLQILKDAAVDCVLNAYYNITSDNPIKCFTFGESETGISFYPGLGQDTVDKMAEITYKQEAISYAVFNIYGPVEGQFYQNGQYLYVYKFAGDPSIVKKEKIKIPKKAKIVTATVLYDKVVAEQGNMLMPKLAIIGDTAIPSNAFEVME